jgi:hypothetical protein
MVPSTPSTAVVMICSAVLSSVLARSSKTFQVVLSKTSADAILVLDPLERKLVVRFGVHGRLPFICLVRERKSRFAASGFTDAGTDTARPAINGYVATHNKKRKNSIFVSSFSDNAGPFGEESQSYSIVIWFIRVSTKWAG